MRVFREYLYGTACSRLTLRAAAGNLSGRSQSMRLVPARLIQAPYTSSRKQETSRAGKPARLTLIPSDQRLTVYLVVKDFEACSNPPKNTLTV